MNTRPARLYDPPTDGASAQLVRVLVVAGVRVYREGIATNLASRDDLSVAGVAANRADALRLLTSVAADVVVLDMALHESLNVARAIRTEAPGVKIVAFAVEELDVEIIACAEAGVAGYVPCEASINDLVATITSVTQGELHCSPRVAATLFRHVAALASKVPGDWGGAALTHREREILALIDAGLSNKEIAVRLHIEVSTVKHHVHNVLEKVQATSRSQAAAQLRARSSGRPSRAKLATTSSD